MGLGCLARLPIPFHDPPCPRIPALLFSTSVHLSLTVLPDSLLAPPHSPHQGCSVPTRRGRCTPGDSARECSASW